MKLFKRLLALCVTACVCFTASCMGGNTKTYQMFASSYWLPSSGSDVGDVEEICVYNISFKEATPENEGDLVLKSDLSGTLTTTLSTTTYNGVKCYKFMCEAQFTGSYFYGDQTAKADSSTTSTSYFLGLSNKLAPLYSTKEVKNVIPANGEKMQFPVFHYKTETVYDRNANSATVTVAKGEECDQSLNIQEGSRTYEKLTKSGTIIDNECLLFAPRAADLEEGFYAYFATIDALSQKVHKMVLSVDSSTPSSELSLNYTINGVPQTPKLNCYNANIAISDTFSGSAIKLCYSDSVALRKRLIKMETSYAYSLGSLVYTLTSVTGNNN